MLAARALGQAVEAGDRDLAVRSARILEEAGLLAPDIRMLLLTEAVRTGDWAAADRYIAAIGKDDIFAFMTPILRAWIAFETGKGDPLQILAAAGDDPLAKAYIAEHRPLILVAQGRKEGVGQLVEVADGAGGRDSRLRIAAAALLAREGDRKAAAAILEGDERPIVAARRLLEARRPIPGAIDGARTGIAELLIRIAIDLHRQNVTPLALTYARLATFLAPENSETWLVTSEVLAAREQPEEALEALTHVAPTDPFAAHAEDGRIRLLIATGETEAALAEAEAAIKAGPPSVADWTRLGDLYGELERLEDAATAYGRALGVAEQQGTEEGKWALWLLRGGALEQAGNWSEAKAALGAAYRLAPQQPIVLNYLGYAQLERRENIDEAMRLIAEASRLQPDSPEITDSLGWAHYLRGQVAKAIPLLEKAVKGQPADPAINEHLGDAYYSAGRHYEARYAWGAALLYAEEEDAERLRAKIEAGLTPKLASP